MFRLKLTLALAILLSIVLLLAATLYWGAQREEYYFQRSQLAHDAALAYVQLSHDAYRHFKKLVDIVALDGDISVEQAKLSYQKLQQSLNQLQIATNAEINHVDEQELVQETQELELINEIEKLLAEGTLAFERIMSLQRRGAEEPAQAVLRTVLEQTIDQQFNPIIDRAIAEEREELTNARQQAQQLLDDLKWMAAITAVVTFFLALAMAAWLLHSLSTPLNQLVKGVRQVAKNDLTHRIKLSGRNEFTYLAKNFNDMTQQLTQQRQHLLLAQAELENKVDTRTYELQQANEKLQHIDEGRLRFLADISHELRTPLTAIRGEAEVTARGKNKSTKEYRDALIRIVELSGQLGKLVEDLLFMARSESASLRFNLSPLVLNNLLNDVCENTQALVRQQQLHLSLELPEHDISVSGDRMRLRQVLLILIDNACRYSRSDSKIIITLHADKDRAIMVVSDQGIGIPSAELVEVFKRFYRGKQARNKVPSGSGLGLPLAKSIIKAHQGTIEASSTPGRGTQVTITLPILSL
ncbi:MAG: ATP-binding protein [Gammaproteobacteria bacterium]|nr:ATP-binding protein [Gammaproteobacteria bacterium]MCF6260119.1 ATP-binding protein [Gammaproteobacteria bacterium]